MRNQVLEGEQDRPERNPPGGELRIEAADFGRDVPKGSDIEVTLEITADQKLFVHAYVPLTRQDWEAELELHRTVAAVDALGQQVTGAETRVADLERRAETTVEPRMPAAPPAPRARRVAVDGPLHRG